ncbi:hypothetical protein ASZ90_009589 [hydrocarbon metagenome]|uniref:Uncharacterized protein n=1 Tax=hydrocarbon metagenome TaxID=938273 RepID=A0A0W8FIG0_9ZZZZ
MKIYEPAQIRSILFSRTVPGQWTEADIPTGVEAGEAVSSPSGRI